MRKGRNFEKKADQEYESDYGKIPRWVNFKKIYEDGIIIKRYFSEIPEFWIPLLVKFESSKPQQFYTEEVRTIVYSLFEKTFCNDHYFEMVFGCLGQDLDNAYRSYNKATKMMKTIEKSSENAEKRLKDYLFPLYLELIEGVWKTLARLCIIVVEEPPAEKIKKYVTYKINVLIEKMKKHGQVELLFGVDRVLRNNIAHTSTVFSDEVHSQNGVVLTNPDLSFMHAQDIESTVIKLYDNCSGIVYAILRYCANQERSGRRVLIGSYIRSQLLEEAIVDETISIESNTALNLSGKTQRNLKINYNYRCDIRVVSFLFYLLSLAVKFLTSDDYFIAVGPNKGMPYVWIKTSNETANNFINGKMSLQQYMRTGDIQLFRPIEKIRRSSRLSILFALPKLILNGFFTIFSRELKYHKGWSVLYEYDFSHGLSRRYEVYVLMNKFDFTNAEIHWIIKKVIKRKRSKYKIFFNSIWDFLRLLVKRRIWKRAPIKVIIVHIVLKEKRRSQFNINPEYGHPFCICSAEWNRDESFKWITNSSEHDEKIEDIHIRWFIDDKMAMEEEQNK